MLGITKPKRSYPRFDVTVFEQQENTIKKTSQKLQKHLLFNKQNPCEDWQESFKFDFAK